MKNILAILIALTLAVGGCAAFKKVVRSVNHIATDLCWIFAEEHPDQLGGLLPSDWCSVKENIDPFIDYVLKASQDGATTCQE